MAITMLTPINRHMTKNGLLVGFGTLSQSGSVSSWHVGVLRASPAIRGENDGLIIQFILATTPASAEHQR